MWNRTIIKAPKMNQLLRLMCTENANAPGKPPLWAWSCSRERRGPIAAVRELQVLDSRMMCILRPCNVQLAASATRHGQAADDLERSLRTGKVFGSLAIARVHEVNVRLGRLEEGSNLMPALFSSAAAFQMARRLQIQALANEFPERFLVDVADPSGWSWGPKRNDPYV